MEGIITIDKPTGITSFDVIRKLRKILKERRIGHTGTLDPLATGVLVICVGRATKLAQDIEGYDKTYIADFQLGYRTDTYDTEGKILEKVENFNVSKEDLENSLRKFIGNIGQIPPMYSAIKIDGKKLYELAREGKEIERASRPVTINKIELLDFDGINGKILCEVSKGTYIRSLIDDLGKDLGVYATMSGLRRTQVGGETLEKSYTLEEIEKCVLESDYEFIRSVENYFNFEPVNIDSGKDKTLYLNGQRVKMQKPDGKCRVYCDGIFLGLGEINRGLLKGYKYY
ncbi:tRNA pseudouridine(55) synthase TruB [Cetobacterium sp. SF1]|uniref:tRNA pseudouridine(55) synthase TruB n=1 Tax=unclassified Cetobacterium TaxID=2630983 RepID=UPI003CF5B33B